MSSLKRIGVFGGTFDPLHNTHYDIARTAIQTANLDLVLFVVSARPPHKTLGPFATPEERFDMVQAALGKRPQMSASRIEIDRKGTSYTRDTLKEVQQRYPEAQLFLILGYDSLLDLPAWKDSRRILDQTRLLVLPRKGVEESAPPQLDGAYELLPFESTSLSSTEIRERVAAGLPYEHMVPPAVSERIYRQGLYEVSAEVRQSPRAGEFIALLSERLPEKTRRHCLSTAQYLTSFATKVGVTFDEAVRAGLLHDAAKGLNRKEILDSAARYGIPINEAQEASPKLLHGPVAAEMCRHELGIEDAAFHDALYWHTTGRPEFGPLGLALYFADYAEPARDYDEARQARNVLDKHGFEKALHYVAEKKRERLQIKGTVVDPMTEAFYAWLKDGKSAG
ncbi:MAG: nicotinate-nucleotide adenylyltransferase [Candidatus Hydrogenedentes bacterium]|nr:nicotinate-nucleotide adenylyltransferase [Candidatus Hydrogenedentota bacterium]